MKLPPVPKNVSLAPAPTVVLVTVTTSALASLPSSSVTSSEPASPLNVTECSTLSTVPPATPGPSLSINRESFPSPALIVTGVDVLCRFTASSPAPALNVTLVRPVAGSVGKMLIVSPKSAVVRPALTTRFVLLANSTGSKLSIVTRRRPSPVAMPSSNVIMLAASVALIVRVPAVRVSVIGSSPV